MTEENAKQFAQQLQIDVYQIIRENWEMIILRDIFDSVLSTKLIFKGGTALRLGYNSPRFSEDLDFSLPKSVKKNEFKEVCQKIAKKYQQIKISDLAEKFYTYLCEFKIQEEYLSRAFSIKIEISKRKSNLGGQLKLLISPLSNLQILARVSTIEEILEDKINALKSRRASRDYFDIWYISEYLKKPMPDNLPKIGKNEFRRDLNKFLPLQYQKAVAMLEEKYAS